MTFHEAGNVYRVIQLEVL